MKKTWLFLFSSFIALSIAIYSQKSAYNLANNKNSDWKTFVKKSKLEVIAHNTTKNEFEVAHIHSPKRTIAQDNIQKAEPAENGDENHNSFLQQAKLIKDNHFLIREDRVLIGDIHKNNYQDENVELPMSNKINQHWKDILGHELLRFQNDDEKVMIKEEYSIIQIQNGNGRYAEQVIVTYVLKDGTINSYHALVDSETAAIIDTWDKTIHENFKFQRANLSLPSENNSGIKAR